MRVAIIGLGPHGRRLAAAVLGIPQLRLTGVVDQNPTALQNAQIDSSVRRFSSTTELWVGSSADLVCISTNAPSHASLALEAMRHGVRHLLVEKPLACSLRECDTLLEEAARTGTRLGVGHLRRLHPAYRWVRDRIRSKAWGSVRALAMQRPGIGLGCNGTHSFDLMRFLTDREVEQVTAWVDPPLAPNPRGDAFVDPGGLVVMELDGGVRAVVSQIEDGAGPMSMEIDCTAGRIRLDEKSGQVEVVQRDRSIPAGPDRPPVYQTLVGPDGVDARFDIVALARELILEVIGAGSIEPTGEHGRAAMEVLVAAYVSHQRGHVPVRLPLTGSAQTDLWLPVT